MPDLTGYTGHSISGVAGLFSEEDLTKMAEDLRNEAVKRPLRPEELLREIGASVVEASKRMSSREIAGWLSARGVAVSQSTVSRFLRRYRR